MSRRPDEPMKSRKFQRKRTPWPRTAFPSLGAPYVRCPLCQEQVFVTVSKKIASERQVGFASAVALRKHTQQKHPKEER